MTFDVENLVIKNNEDEKQFQAQLDDDNMAFVEYMIAGQWIVFTHTEVPEKYEGMGIASKMARVALDYAAAQGYRVQPLCPYIAQYIRRHPEYQPITLGYRSA